MPRNKADMRNTKKQRMAKRLIKVKSVYMLTFITYSKKALL